MTRNRILWALIALLLVAAGVAIGVVIAKPMTSFGRAFTAANLAAALVALALLWWLIKGRD